MRFYKKMIKCNHWDTEWLLPSDNVVNCQCSSATHVCQVSISIDHINVIFAGCLGKRITFCMLETRPLPWYRYRVIDNSLDMKYYPRLDRYIAWATNVSKILSGINLILPVGCCRLLYLKIIKNFNYIGFVWSASSCHWHYEYSIFIYPW